MAEPAPNLVLLPQADTMPVTLEVPRIPRMQQRVDRIERERTIGNWGDLGGARLTSVLRRAEKGDVADWYDLCEFFLKTDPSLASYYTTRVDRVAQADFVVTPCTIGNQTEAAKAAALVNDCLARIENWEEAKRHLLHAIAPGFAAAENEWAYDEESATNYVKTFDLVHGHRFRYDEQWNLRLYDHGHRRSDASQWGEALPPSKWTVHRYLPVAGYPGLGGLMAACAYFLAFMRWVDKYWITYTEKNGGPTVYASVGPNTAERVRQQILDDLVLLTTQRVGVVEAGTTLTFETGAAATKSYEAYKDYQSYHDAQIQKLWLGSSDQADPGAHGSNAAVSTRASATLDPRMITDGNLFAASLRRTLFKQLIMMNAHKFAIPANLVPVPEFRFKSADDEVKRDASGMAQEQADQRQAYGTGIDPQPPAPVAPQPAVPPAPANPGGLELLPPGGMQPPVMPQPGAIPPPSQRGPGAGPAGAAGDVQKQALNGAQVTSLLEVLRAVASGELPRATGVEVLVTAFNVDRAAAEQMMGTVGTPAFEPKAEPAPPNPFGPPPGETPPQLEETKAKPVEASAHPKGSAPVGPGRPTTTTRATSGRSPSLFAHARRSASAASGSSSSRQLPLQLKP